MKRKETIPITMVAIVNTLSMEGIGKPENFDITQK